MNIKLKYAKIHLEQFQHNRPNDLLNQAQMLIECVDYSMQEPTVYMIFLAAQYDDFTKKMTTWCAFVNNTGKDIKELHGEIRFQSREEGVQIATTIVDMNQAFLGELKMGEGVLVNFNIPVKGMKESKKINYSDLTGRFDDVRVTYIEK